MKESLIYLLKQHNESLLWKSTISIKAVITLITFSTVFFMLRDLKEKKKIKIKNIINNNLFLV